MARQLQTVENYSLDKILLTEGRRYNLMVPSTLLWWYLPPDGPVTNGPQGPVVPVGSLSVPPGKCFIVNQIQVNTTGNCAIYVNISNNDMPNVAETGGMGALIDPGIVMELTDVITDPNGGSVKFTFPQPLVLWESSLVNLSYFRPLDELTEIGAQMIMSVIDITNDMDYTASKRIAVLGDSITWTSGGIYTSGKSYWPFLVTTQQRANGESVRLINKGFGGATSQEAAVMMRAGYMNFDYDLLFISVGMNDAAAGSTSEINFKAALRLMITLARERNPNCTIILCGASSTDDPNRTPYIADYRIWTLQVQQEYTNANKVYYVDLSTAYSAAQTQYFTEVSTPRIHPNKAGHALIFGIINTFMINNNIEF